jgi:hypothetical protein
MGACSFVNKGRGKSMRDVYSDLVDEATSEYGHDSYNGTISTTHGYQDITNEWKASKEDIRTFISKKLENANKYDCFGVCTVAPKVNSNKIKSQVEHFVEKGTKKWVLKYVVSDYDNQIGKYSTKGEAVKAARAYTEKNLRSTTIHMNKVLEKGSTQVAKVVYKRSVDEKDGEFIFFGYAAV